MSRADIYEQLAPSTEQHIDDLENRLGLKKRSDILIEAALVIDKKFLDTAIMMGTPTKPERIFGDRAWAGYLEARLFAKQYGDQPLTSDFITNIHQRFLDNLLPGRKSSLTRSGGRGGKFVNGQFSPIECSLDQITIINDNPMLHFVPDETSNTPTKGFIHYTTMSKKRRQIQLDQICADYNTLRLTEEPYHLAAITQRNFVSLHPLSYDFTGRVSRILMNWSLENAAKDPSIVGNMDDDLLLSEKDWTERVRQGSIRHAKYKKRAASGETDPVILFGLQQKKSRYEAHSEKSEITPPPLLGDRHNHTHYDAFLAQLET